MEKINYGKLNERIVEQAYETAFGEISKEQLQKLIRDKFERAAAYRAALQNLPAWHTDS
jgi:hypothetical protein